MRTYEIQNKKLPSVTTILQILRSPSLERWRGDVGNLVADSRSSDGASRGTSVHSLCEYLARHGTAPPSIPTHLRSRYAAFASFYEDHVARVVDCEAVIHYTHPEDPLFGYAGRCDLVVILKSGLTAAIDLKTSKVINEKMGMQLAAYARGYTHTHEPTQIHSRMVVQLHGSDPYYNTMFPPTYARAIQPLDSPDPGYTVYEFLDYDLDLYGFDSAHALFVWASRSGLLDREFR